MIAVSSSSRSFAALGKYLVVGRDKVEQGRVGWTSARNLPTDEPELAAKIMRATAAQNVRVSQPVYHIALSFDPTDNVNRATMERVAAGNPWKVGRLPPTAPKGRSRKVA